MARARKRIATFAPLEREIQQAVVEHWQTLGLPNTLVAAIPNAYAHGQPGLTKGLADLLVVGPGIPGYPCGFIELKRDPSAKRSDAQWKFAKLCHALGIPYAVCFGRDEPIELLRRWRVIHQ